MKSTMKYGMAFLGLLVMLGTGCEKIRKAMEEASAKKSEASTSSASGSAEVRHIVGVSEFNSFINQKDKVVVIDFYADWCGPCRRLAPTLEKVVGEFGSQAVLGKVNVDKNRELASKWRISSIPDVRIFRGGKQVDAFMGLIPEAKVRQFIQHQVSKLPPPKAETKTETTGQDSADGSAEAKKEPPITRMKKDWVPPGVERR